MNVKNGDHEHLHEHQQHEYYPQEQNPLDTEDAIVLMRSANDIVIDRCRKGNTVLVIGGPTAAGKTETACRLYDLLGSHRCELLSADARQIYRLLDIGTGKLTTQELQQYPHHCINIKNPNEYYSAGSFGDESAMIVEEILQAGKIPIIVGGSGLYVRALCEGLFLEEFSESAEAIRLQLEERLVAEGIAVLYHELQDVDPVLAEKYIDLNPRRLVRALSFYHTHHIPLSQAQRDQRTIRTFDSVQVGLYVERSTLYNRINGRVQSMFDMGLLEETQSILEAGYAPDCNALNTVGYKECIRHIAGELSLEEAIFHARQSTRRYAKRQMTWFRKQEAMSWMSAPPAEIAHELAALAEQLLP